MIPPISSIRQSFPIPPALNGLLPYPRTPWNLSQPLFNRLKTDNPHDEFATAEVLNSDPEFDFVCKYFEQQKPIGYSIKKIVCIHNSNQLEIFERTLKRIEKEAASVYFSPIGKYEDPQADRARALARWASQTAPFSPVEVNNSKGDKEKLSQVKILPLWHGCSQDVHRSICEVGFTFFGKHHYFHESATRGINCSTDKGYFGSGLYFTNSAHYAAMYTGEKYLALAWVAMREPYPVVNDVPHPNKGSDMRKLVGQHAYQNYNAHYIPVLPADPGDSACAVYHPCYENEPPTCDEVVVFHNSQTLPSFFVELEVDFPTSILRMNAQQKENKENERKAENFTEEVIFLGSESIQLSENRANRNIATIYFDLGLYFYSSATNNWQLQEKAVEWFQKAAELNHRDAKLFLGFCHDKGHGVDQDLKKAAEWFQDAASQGQINAQFYSGLSFYKGQGVKQDYREAIYWFRKAAEQEHLNAFYYLGLCYKRGHGVSKDYKQAFEWFSKADRHGLAIYRLGKCYKNGRGVAINYDEAIVLFRRAVGWRVMAAHSQLAKCYDEGLGVEIDVHQALKNYCLAAGQDDVPNLEKIP